MCVCVCIQVMLRHSISFRRLNLRKQICLTSKFLNFSQLTVSVYQNLYAACHCIDVCSLMTLFLM